MKKILLKVLTLIFFCLVNNFLFGQNCGDAGLSLNSPGLVSPASNSTFTSSPTSFSFNSNNTTSNAYRIQISNSTDNWISSICAYNCTTTTNSQLIVNQSGSITTASGLKTITILNNLPPGTYYWTVRVGSGSNQSCYDANFKKFTITSPCSYSISPTSKSFTSNTGTGSISVTAGSGCSWSANESYSWITITSGSSGSGNGTCSYSVSSNTSSSSRTGSITIAGETYSISQAGVSSSCIYSISPTSNSFLSNAGNGSISVSAGVGCSWSASSNNLWITTNSSGSGSGTCNYSVTSNTSSNSRTGSITIAGETYSISQAGMSSSCSYSISPTSNSFLSNAGNGSISVTTGSGCTWSASSNNSWITTNSSGSGSGTCNYSVTSNTSSNSRTGSITIAGETFSITQAAQNQNGYLKVNFTPNNPAGAMWRVDGGNWLSSGSQVTVSVGQHTIDYKDVLGYITPSTQTINISSGQTNTINENYNEVTVTIICNSVPPFERLFDMYNVSLKVSDDGNLGNWRLQLVSAYNNSGALVINESVSTYPSDGSLQTVPINANASSFLGDVYYRIIFSNGLLIDFPNNSYKTRITERAWEVKKNYVYYNNGSNYIRIPAPYISGVNPSIMKLSLISNPYTLGSGQPFSFLNSLFSGSNSFYVNNTLSSPDYGYFIIPQSILQSLQANEYFYLIYDLNAYYESKSFELTKIGRTRSNGVGSENLIVFIGDIGSDIEADIQTHSVNGENSSSNNSFSLASWNNFDQYDCWYIAATNGNYTKRNAHAIGIAIEKIKEIYNNNIGEIKIIAHGKGGMDVKAMISNKGVSFSGSNNFNYSNSSFCSKLKKIVFLGTPSNGTTWRIGLNDFLNNFSLNINFSENYGMGNEQNSPALKDLNSATNIFNELNNANYPSNIEYLNVTAYEPTQFTNGENGSDGIVSVASSKYFSNKFDASLLISQIYLKSQIFFNFNTIHELMVNNYQLNRNYTNPCSINTTGTESTTLKLIEDFIGNLADYIIDRDCDIATKQCKFLTWGSILSGSNIFLKATNDSIFRYLGITNDVGMLNSNMLGDSLKQGDSLKITAPNYLPITFAVNNEIISSKKISIPMLKSNTTINSIMYPKVEIINQSNIIDQPTLSLKITAKNLFTYQLKLFADTVWTNYSPSDSLINISLDTGQNLIFVSLISAIDTFRIQKSIYYYPISLQDSLVNQLTINVPTSLYGTKLNIDNYFEKELSSGLSLIKIPTGLRSVSFSRFGYKEYNFDTELSASFNLNMIPQSYSSLSDSNIINFSQNSNIHYWKNITMQDNSNLSNNIISLKQYDDNFSTMGFVPKSRKFIFRNMNMPNYPVLRTAIALDQAEYLDNDSIYLMNIKNTNQFRKYPIDSLGFCSYDSVTQKLSYENLNFGNGTSQTEELVIMKKLPPQAKPNASITLLEDVPQTFNITDFFADPDSIADIRAISASGSNLTTQINGNFITIKGNLNWNGNTQITISSKHDWLERTYTFPVTIISIDDPPVINTNPSVRYVCFGDSLTIPVGSYISDVDNTLSELLVQYQNLGIYQDAIMQVNQTTQSLFFKPVISSPIEKTYPLLIIAKDPYDSIGMDTLKIIVRVSPIANYQYTNTCHGSYTNFNDLSITNGSNITGFKWDFGNGDTSIVKNPTYKFSNLTNYNVSLKIKDSLGCISSLLKTITIDSLPKANFKTDTACLHIPTSFVNLSENHGSANNSFYWIFGDGNSAYYQNATYTYLDAVNYSASLIVTNQRGCKDTITKQVIINPLPIAKFTYTDKCWKDSAVFISTSLPGAGLSVTNYLWNFGDGYSSTLSSPKHKYAMHGNYNVLLNIKNSNTCTKDTIINIVINPLPAINFNYSQTCLHDTTQFINQTNHTSIINNWIWSFGDNTSTSLLLNPKHLYNTSNTFNVKLLATDVLGCKDSITKAVIIDSLPTANFAFDTVCLNNATHFSDLSVKHGSNINYWLWKFGDGDTSFLQHTNHNYANATTYPVKLIIKNIMGCKDSVSKTIKTNPLPIANFIYTGKCWHDSTKFVSTSIANGGNIISYLWNFGDGFTSTLQNPIHLFASPGTFNVNLKITNSNACIKDTIISIIINSLPVPEFTSPATGIVSQSIQFLDISLQSNAPITSWIWNLNNGNGNVNGTPNPSVANSQFTSPGTYNVQLITIDTNHCRDTIIHQIMISSNIIMGFTVNDTCMGSPTYFTDTSTIVSGSIISWQWNFGDTTSSTIQNPVHNYSNYGTYNVMLVVKSNLNFTDTLIKQLTIYPNPEVYFTPDITDSCAALTVNFTDSTKIQSGNLTQWLWDFSDFPTSTAHPIVSHTFTNSGFYKISLSVTSDKGCKGIFSVDSLIWVQPVPTASFSTDRDITTILDSKIKFTDLSTGTLLNSWNWDFGDLNTSNIQHSSHEYLNKGEYWVSLTVTNQFGCWDTTRHHIWIKGADAIYVPNAFSPNGDGVNDDFLPVGTFNKEGPFEMIIYNRWGIIVFETKAYTPWDGRSGNSNEFCTEGVYIWKISYTDIDGLSKEIKGRITLVR